MKFICYFVALLLLVLPATSFSQTLKWQIGVLAPLSGDVASWGQDTKRAVELANEMLGQGQFNVIFEDDRCLGKNAVTGAQKLVSVDQVNFGMIVCTEPTLSAAPIFEKNKVVVVAPGATAAAVTHAGDHIFRTWPSDAKIVEVVLDYMQSRYKHPAIISESRGMPQEFSRVFRELSASKKLQISSEDFLSGETNFQSLLLRLRQQTPDALLINTDSDRTLLDVVKQLHVLNWRIPVLGQFIVGTPQFYEKAGDLAEGFVFGDSPDVDCTTGKPGCDVFKEFIRRYGQPQSSGYMVGASIASFMAIAAAARSGEPPKDYLYKARLDTLLGPISFDKNGDIVGPTHSLKIIEHGKPRLLTSQEGGTARTATGPHPAL